MHWVTRHEYDTIIAPGPRVLSEKGKTYSLPMSLQSKLGVQSEERHIRIGMAIVGDTHVLVFIDHNMDASRLHLTEFYRLFTMDDLHPDSLVSDPVLISQRFLF